MSRFLKRFFQQDLDSTEKIQERSVSAQVIEVSKKIVFNQWRSVKFIKVQGKCRTELILDRPKGKNQWNQAARHLNSGNIT